MSLLKKMFILLALTTYLPANFSLSAIQPTSPIEPSLTKQVVYLDEESDASLNPDIPVGSFDDPSEPNEFSYWQEFFRMMLILGFILGGVLIIAWFLKGYLNKRIKQVNQQNQIKVLERRNLSQKSMLYLIEIEGKKVVISDSAAGGVQLIMNCENQIEQEQSQKEALKTQSIASKFSFTQILQRKLSNKNFPPFTHPKNLKTDYEIHEEN